MNSTHQFFLSVFVLLAFFCPKQAIGQNRSPQTIEELSNAIQKVLEETGTPAVGLALVDGDSAIWVDGLGKANLEKNINATESTMFRIGSTTKMFVSLAILKLQEERRVSLKDKVSDLVPEIEFDNPWEKTTPVLIEHLLEHTTGWDDLHITEYALNDAKLSLKEGIDFHPHSRTSRWMPGTRMAYCNAGPAVAAYIVEKITGRKFEDYIQEQFFNPMGMETMTFFPSEQYKKLGATLYNNKVPQKYWNIAVRPSGSINASPIDMARMLKFFINRGRVDSLRLISEASLRRMETPTSSTGAKGGLEYGYGLSNYSTPHKSFVYRSHNGGVMGGLTDFSYLPSHQVGYVIMINSGDGSALYRIKDLIRNYQTENFAYSKINKGQVEITSDNNMTGYYVPINPRLQISHFVERILNVKYVEHKNNFIFSKNLLGGHMETYIALNNDQFVSSETGKISLVKVIDPLAGEVLHADTQVLLRISSMVAIGQLVLGAVWILYLICSLCFGTIWFILYWRGKISNRKNITLLIYPFLASLLFLMIVILQFVAINNPIELLGNVGFVSVSIMLLSICFALASLWSIIILIKERKIKINRNIYWHLAILSSLHLMVTCYLLWHGQIGIQTWN